MMSEDISKYRELETAGKGSIKNREALLGLLLAVLAGILLDRVLLNGLGGFGFSILMCSLIVLYLVMLRGNLKLKGNSGLLWFIPISVMIFRSTFYDNEIIHGLNIMFLPIVMTGGALAVWFHNLEYHRPISNICSHIFAYPLLNLLKPLSVIKKLLPSRKDLKGVKINPHFLAGVLLSIPLLLIVLAFLSSADQMFNYYVGQFLNSFNFMKSWHISDETLVHIFIITGGSLYFFAFVWSFTVRKTSQPFGSKFEIEALTISVPVSLLNIVYLFFSVIQFSYLYGGGTLPAGFTYAEYARRGFFELVAVTVINFTIILVGVNRTKVSGRRQSSFCNLLFTLLILFTFNMLYSAYYKMRLYENTYGYTYLRVYVSLFMLLLLILNLSALVAIWYKKISLYKAVVIVSISFYTLINLFNADAYIAKANIEVYRHTGRIDAKYLTTLSNDAVPYLLELSSDTSPDVAAVIQNDLNKRRINLNSKDKSTNILQFNFSRQHARRLLR
ncbi:MAG: DUF4173 domain-containing protein [Bacillota bacterium]|nr:DUF4173 domain-containing protein [Bacillota bacterium]